MVLVARFDDGFRQRKESRANWQSALLRKFVSNFYTTMMPFINPSEHLVDIRNAERKTALFRGDAVSRKSGGLSHGNRNKVQCGRRRDAHCSVDRGAGAREAGPRAGVDIGK